MIGSGHPCVSLQVLMKELIGVIDLEMRSLAAVIAQKRSQHSTLQLVQPNKACIDRRGAEGPDAHLKLISSLKHSVLQAIP